MLFSQTPTEADLVFWWILYTLAFLCTSSAGGEKTTFLIFGLNLCLGLLMAVFGPISFLVYVIFIVPAHLASVRKQSVENTQRLYDILNRLDARIQALEKKR